MNCYRETYDRLVKELKTLETYRENMIGEYNDLSSEYKALATEYNMKRMGIDADWQNEVNKYLKLILRLFVSNVGLAVILVIINSFGAFVSTGMSILLAALAVIIGTTTGFLIDYKKHSKIFEDFELRRFDLKDSYEKNLEILHSKLNASSNELNRIDMNISDNKNEINSLIMGYGKLCLGISDINENAPSDNKAYVRKRTINDK